MTRTTLAVLALAALLALPLAAQEGPAPVPAQTNKETKPSPADEAAELARRAAEKIVEALRAVIASIPQYEAPEVLPNGDILIRRKHPPPAPEPEAKPKETRT